MAALIEVAADASIVSVRKRRGRRAVHQPASPSPPARPRAWPGLLGAVGLGALVGALSAWAFPDPLFGAPVVPWASLVVAPLAMGGLLHLWGRFRRSRGRSTTILATFAGGALFAFASALVRRLLVA